MPVARRFSYLPPAIEEQRAFIVQLGGSLLGLAAVAALLQIGRADYKHRREEEDAARRLQDLSPRERDVFDAVSTGMVTKGIACRLGISARTVDVHRSRIMQKLAIDSPLQLANFLAVLERKASRTPLPNG